MNEKQILDKNKLTRARLLRQLFRKRFILKSMNESAFRDLVDQRDKIQNDLDPFLAQLHLDESLGVAFLNTISEDYEEEISYSLFDYKKLSMFSSLLLFFLRNEHMEYYKNPEPHREPRCEAKHLREFLLSFNSFESDQKFEKAFKKSIKVLLELRVLKSLGESDQGPFVITPVCNYLLTADQLEEFSKDLEIFFTQQGAAEKQDLIESEEALNA